MQRNEQVKLPQIFDPRGNLTFLQYPDQIPFVIKRVFWTYDVPGGEIRGGHAFRQQQELIIALSGSFDVVITNERGEEIRTSLNRSYHALFLPKMTWRHLENFSTNAVALHLSDTEYLKEDYIRDFEIYKELKNGK
ncbi:FdtA/QdtA family cupin domain-containing protein [Algoriphagus lutimaris]|uniref:sugar 3,4-ketoisomerase n=1 Tax=Algoriphagus lutimaris TaxID=613197 RepID=UPI00196A9CA4|nr:FdtA/QdtA family cupin domain-containing protein [Algoriphagus lutimaris]MBN3518703.1 FdtA/QdtA family cupin domain-containing protein [Algoriphagus lutimaris]